MTLYAKYDYMLTSITCSGTYTVTDAGTSKNPSISMSVNLKNTYYERFKGTTLKKVRIEFSLKLWEVNDGYQHIYLEDGDYNGVVVLPFWSKKIDHDGNAKTYKYTIELDLESYKDINSFVFRFDASGAFSDTWKFEDFTAQAYLVN